MASFREFVDKLKRGPGDVVGIDFGATGTKVARLRKGDSETTLLAADILPPIGRPWEAEEPSPPLSLPPKLKAKHAALAVSGSDASVKLLVLAGHAEAAITDKVMSSMGVDDESDNRVAYKIIEEGTGRTETRVLAVSMQEAQAHAAVSMLPSGTPAPYSVELSGLATLTAFSHSAGLRHEDDAVGALDFGATTSTLALFNKGIPALVRRFGIGTRTIVTKVQETLGVDEQTAEGIIADGAFDISQPVSDVMELLVKQMVVSRGFVERRENCHFGKMYVSGGLVTSRDSLDEVTTSMGIEVDFWDPMESLSVSDGAIPEHLQGQEWRLSAAVGACLGVFEAT